MENRDHNPAAVEAIKDQAGQGCPKVYNKDSDGSSGRARHREVHNVERQKCGSGASPGKSGEAQDRSPQDTVAGGPTKATGDKPTEGLQVESQLSAT